MRPNKRSPLARDRRTNKPGKYRRAVRQSVVAEARYLFTPAAATGRILAQLRSTQSGPSVVFVATDTASAAKLPVEMSYRVRSVTQQTAKNNPPDKISRYLLFSFFCSIVQS